MVGDIGRGLEEMVSLGVVVKLDELLGRVGV